MFSSRRAVWVCLLGVGAATAPLLAEGAPKELRRGEAPILFTQGHSGAALRDGTVATPDEIYLWIPQLKFNNSQVDLNAVGRFFKIWDSGPVAGPNGNDDNTNELRTLHFEPQTGTFLLSYDDTTTTGFDPPFDAIDDGDLLRLTPTSLSNGFIDAWSFQTVYNEGLIGAPGTLTDTDLWGFGLHPTDGSMFWGGFSVTLDNDQATTTFKASNDLAHTEGLVSSSPLHLGEPVFFTGNAPLPNESQLNGQMRGVDVLDTGEALISVSNTFENGDGISTTVVLDRWDIGALEPVTRQAEVVYPGELFFQTIDTLNAEMIEFDVLDTPEAINAMIDLVGPTSSAGVALRAFADPPPSLPAETMLLTSVQFNSQTTTIRNLDLNSATIAGTFIPGNYPDNGRLLPAEDIKAGPGRTVLVAQPGGDGKIGRYDENGVAIDVFIGGQAQQSQNPVDNIRGMARSSNGSYLYTSDWTGDNVHRFDFFSGTPMPIASDPLGEFIPAMLPPPDLSQAHAIEVLANGDLLVGDRGASRLKRFDRVTGVYIADFSLLPIGPDIRDIDVLDNGDVIVAHRNQVDRLSPTGLLLNSFPFSIPCGVHLLPTGNYAVTSTGTIGQGQGLFVVKSDGVILHTMDNSRGYGPLELIDFINAHCAADANGDGAVDVNDISYVLFRLGLISPNDAGADVNGDSVVDVNDISFVLFRLGDPCP